MGSNQPTTPCIARDRRHFGCQPHELTEKYRGSLEALRDTLRRPPLCQADVVVRRKHAGSLEALRVARPKAVDLGFINMSLHKDFASMFFESFAELFCSRQQLVSVEGQFIVYDDPPGPPLLVAIKLYFENISILAIVQNDDSIELRVNGCFVDAPDHEVRVLNELAPWNAAISRPLLWAWMMINQQGYFDGLQFDFAENVSAPVSRIQLLALGCGFKYQ